MFYIYKQKYIYFFRAILNKILTGCQESARMYATQLLRALVRVGAEDFSRWGIELLVGQLYDESRLVAHAALDVLDEACDNEVCGGLSYYAFIECFYT